MKATRWSNVGRVVATSLMSVLLFGNLGALSAAEKDQARTDRGKELFTREWLPGDHRSHAGDGLGPLFNARSCAECHSLGGVGGAGPKHTNVTLISAFLEGRTTGLLQGLIGPDPKPDEQPDRNQLAVLHPALRTENSFTLHRFGSDEEFVKWKRAFLRDRRDIDVDLASPEELGLRSTLSFRRLNLLPVKRTVGNATIQLNFSERNAPTLFGVGLIDRIPEEVLEAVATSQADDAEATPAEIRRRLSNRLSLPVAGRVARLKDGRAGRFGWKGQTATLRDFTLQACATELGLEVPGFPQSAPPWKAQYKSPGLDLTAKQCDELIAFVASLPPPLPKKPETIQHEAEVFAGRKLFKKIGCAACHLPKLGDVEGIYSDLLLHDMGPSLSDSGLYGSPTLPGELTSDRPNPLPVLRLSELSAKQKKLQKFGASAREWRTPPLWGLRDSAPYLHDGRADTISAAVAFHGGEGLEAAQHFFSLEIGERLQVELFLQSLAIPVH